MFEITLHILIVIILTFFKIFRLVVGFILSIGENLLVIDDNKIDAT